MTISITLTPDQERQLEALARQSGKDPSVYVNDVVAAFLERVTPNGEKRFAEILDSIWEGWRQSGMTESDIDDPLQRELLEVRRARHRPSEPA
jgi:hypothetical protein